MKHDIPSESTRSAQIIELETTSDDGPLRAALSSEAPVERGYYTEILRHDANSIVLDTANKSGLPLTVNHSERDMTSPALPIGRVRNFSIDKGRLRGDLVFDSDDQAQSVRGKVLRGIAPDVSITYSIQDYDGPTDDGNVTVTKWQPRAVSIVTMPADPGVGVGRSHSPGNKREGRHVENTSEPGATATPDKDSTIIKRIESESRAGFSDGAAAENSRLSAITDMAGHLRRSMPTQSDAISALEREAVADRSITSDRFNALALRLVSGANVEPLAGESSRGDYAPQITRGDARRPFVQPGADESEKMTRGLELAMYERFGGKPKDDEMRGNQYRGWSWLDMGRELLGRSGMNLRGMNSKQIAQRMIGSRTIAGGAPQYDSTDFTSVTLNIGNMRVHDGFREADVTWNQWCSEFEASDFKQFAIPRLSQFSNLQTVAESAQIPDLTQADDHELATLVNKAGKTSLSWQAIVNDSQAMFGRQMFRLGEAAGRTVDVNAYTVLTANAAMRDTVTLFHATHSNDAAAAISQAAIVQVGTAMGRQTDDNSVVLGIVPRYLLVPLELRDVADDFANSEYLAWPEGSPATTRRNTIRGTFVPIATARLTDVNDWYMAAAAGGTVEVAFLTGYRTPQVESEDGWDYLAIHFRVVHPHVAYPVDWRGLQRRTQP